MSVAIEFGCMKAIRAMLKYPINLGMKTQDGFTHLMNAARFGWDEIILELIQAGADVNAQTANGTTALSLAMKFEYDEVVKLLLQANANIYQVDEVMLYCTSFLELLINRH